jgi:hypothetical protein
MKMAVKLGPGLAGPELFNIFERLHASDPLANPINTSPDTTVLTLNEVYEYCTLQKQLSNTPPKRLEHRRHKHSRHSANANIYDYPRQNYHLSQYKPTSKQHVMKEGTHHQHHNVSPCRPPPRLSHSPQTQQSSPVRIPTGTLDA